MQDRAQIKEDISRNRRSVEKMLAEAKDLEVAMSDLPEGSRERMKMQSAYDTLLQAAKELAESTHRISSSAVKSF